jgi:hypothetical protein
MTFSTTSGGKSRRLYWHNARQFWLASTCGQPAFVLHPPVESRCAAEHPLGFAVARSAENPWRIASAVASAQNVNIHWGSNVPCFRYAASFVLQHQASVAIAVQTSMPSAGTSRPAPRLGAIVGDVMHFSPRSRPIRMKGIAPRSAPRGSRRWSTGGLSAPAVRGPPAAGSRAWGPSPIGSCSRVRNECNLSGPRRVPPFSSIRRQISR